MEIETIEIAESGNTKIPKCKKKKQCNQSKRWCMTFNNYSKSDYDKLLEQLEINLISYVIGEEVGESGTPHLQGYIESLRRIRPTELKMDSRIHWEMAKGNQEENIIYCSKDGVVRTKGLPIIRKPRIISETQLYPWQLEILDIIKSIPDDRTIHWYWEPTGKAGKTCFSKYLAYHHMAIPLEGCKKDILFCAANFPSHIYVYDLERSMEDFVSYASIEKIKNGFFMCSKYESKPVLRDNPHVLIFANFPPDREELSEDRWHIVKLDMNTECRHPSVCCLRRIDA